MKMRKLILILTLILGGSIGMRAETVSQKQASQLAQIFFNEAYGQVMAPVKMVYNGRYLTTGRLFVPFYVYNEPAGGFVIISAENKTFPILGYSLEEHFDADKLGERAKALLTSYALDIEHIRYDSRTPEEAIKAWQNYPDYIMRILEAKPEITDPKISIEEAQEKLGYVVDSGLAEETASDIYSPQQWEELINEELERNKSVALGIITNGNVYPAVIHGKRGDYYRMELDGRNKWLMRLLPSELLSGLQIADFTYPKPQPMPALPDTTYRFYDDFRREVAETESAVEPYRIDSLLPKDVKVEGIGGSHYAITLPEDVRMVTIYNLAGAISNIRTYKNTPTAFVDLSGEPNGFYFALLVGESGKTYGAKLAK
ncbi:MAG: Spi family protease inhibitor [Muribaculaceae bacterium]|nr:Spi family protease inhibitor [Muribaculaceae bacterium]